MRLNNISTNIPAISTSMYLLVARKHLSSYYESKKAARNCGIRSVKRNRFSKNPFKGAAPLRELFAPEI